MPYLIPQDRVINSPFKPDAGLVRTVVASVFDRDVSADANLSEYETITVLGTKLLLDMGYTPEHAQAIFRHYRADIKLWVAELRARFCEGAADPGPMMLVILDNTITTLLRSKEGLGKDYFNFKQATMMEAPKRPVLQVGISLSRLFSLVLGDPTDRWYPRALMEAAGVEPPADQSAH